jgi:hypothetical protein
MVRPFGLHGHVLDERAAQRDVEDLDPAAHAEDGQARSSACSTSFELELVTADRSSRMLSRILPVATRVDVSSTAEEDSVAGVQRIVRVTVDARQG